MEVLKSKSEYRQERISVAVNAILDELGLPETDLHQRSLAAFKRGDFDYVKDLSAMHLNDFYCKSLGELVAVYEPNQRNNIALILASSGRAAADFVRQKVLLRLGALNAKTLCLIKD